MTNQRFIVIADSHLGIKSRDVETMIRFIATLDPVEEQILFLGDLFHIWAGPEKYHTSPVKTLLPVLKKFRQADGQVHLVVGNRDIFLPEVHQGNSACALPFDSISQEFGVFSLQGQKLAAFHGDTINSKDKRYLRWRRLVRHPLFQGVFNLLPDGWVTNIMFRLEDQLKSTNLEFRRQFPADEWSKFMEKVNRELAPKLLIAGHFHPDQPIVSSHACTMGVVVPDWHTDQSYLEISPEMEFYHRRFKSCTRPDSINLRI